MSYHAMGRKADSDSALAALEKKYGGKGADANEIAEVFAFQGDIDSAIAWLETAYQQRDYHITWINFNPLFTSLHGDRRFKALLRKMNLPEYLPE